MNQFRLADIRPSADGKTIYATIVDSDWTRMTEAPICVRRLGETDTGEKVKFPAGMLVGDLIDLDRADLSPGTALVEETVQVIRGCKDWDVSADDIIQNAWDYDDQYRRDCFKDFKGFENSVKDILYAPV